MLGALNNVTFQTDTVDRHGITDGYMTFLSRVVREISYTPLTKSFLIARGRPPGYSTELSMQRRSL